MLQRISIYHIEANLKHIDDSTTRFPFFISARNYYNAEAQLEKYLTENKKDTGLIFESVVGTRLLSTNSLIVDLTDDNHVIVDIEQLVNEKQQVTDPQVLKVAKLLKCVIGCDEFYSHAYPLGVRVLKEFINEANSDTEITLKDSDFVIINETNGVNADGYPWIRETIKILPYSIFVHLLICHHEKWDFYIEKVQI